MQIWYSPSKLFHFLRIVIASIILTDKSVWSRHLRIQCLLRRILKLYRDPIQTRCNLLLLIWYLSQQRLLLIILWLSRLTHKSTSLIINKLILLLLCFLVTYIYVGMNTPHLNEVYNAYVTLFTDFNGC
jgi:hypothetical protein